jgi:hypothetical protein
LSRLSLNPKLLLTAFIGFNICILFAGQFYVSFSIYWGAVALNAGGVAFEYSMWEGIRQLYLDKIYGISILLTIWSGIWPHVKLLTMLAFVWIPGGLVANQAEALRWFAFFGKFSFVDVWVVVIIILAVRINENLLPGVNIALWVQAQGELGVFCFCLAIILSQMLGQLSAHVLEHRIPLETGSLEELLPPSFIAYLQSSRTDVKVHTRVCLSLTASESMPVALVRVVSVVLCLLSFVIGIGLFIPTFRVTYAAGGSDFAEDDYSFASGLVTAALPNHVGSKNAVLASLGMLLLVAMPLLQLSLVCLIWFRDNSYRQAEVMFAVLGALRYWACLDSFVLALLVVISEISQLLNTSPLGRFVQVYMTPLPFLYILGSCSVVLGLVLWVLDFEGQMKRVLTPRGGMVHGRSNYEPLLLNLESESNASIDV